MNLHSEAMSAMDLLVDTSSRREWVSRRLRNHLWGGSWKCLTNSFLKEVRLLWHKAASSYVLSPSKMCCWMICSNPSAAMLASFSIRLLMQHSGLESIR